MIYIFKSNIYLINYTIKNFINFISSYLQNKYYVLPIYPIIIKLYMYTSTPTFIYFTYE